jgi:hypothetical protein
MGSVATIKIGPPAKKKAALRIVVVRLPKMKYKGQSENLLPDELATPTFIAVALFAHRSHFAPV